MVLCECFPIPQLFNYQNDNILYGKGKICEVQAALTYKLLQQIVILPLARNFSKNENDHILVP